MNYKHSLERGLERVSPKSRERSRAPTGDDSVLSKPAGHTFTVAGPGIPENDAEMGDHNAEKDELIDFIGQIGNMEPTVYDVVSDMLLQQVGSSGNSYKRETRNGLHNMVSEIYSPPRINAEPRQRPRRHVLPGFSFDVTTNGPSDGQPWGFRIESKRRRAREMIRQHKPFVPVGSPECTAFSS